MCKNIFGLQLSKYGYVICGRISQHKKDTRKDSYFIQYIDINGEVVGCEYSDTAIRNFKVSDRGVNTEFKERSDVDLFFKRTMDDKVFYFTKTSCYIHSWVDKSDCRKITYQDKGKIRLRHFCPGSYKIIGECETKKGVKEYRILEPKSEFTEKWLNSDVIL